MVKKITYNYNRGINLIDIIVRDESGAKLEFFRFYFHDLDGIKECFKEIKKKYGLDIEEDTFFDF